MRSRSGHDHETARFTNRIGMIVRSVSARLARTKIGPRDQRIAWLVAPSSPVKDSVGQINAPKRSNKFQELTTPMQGATSRPSRTNCRLERDDPDAHSKDYYAHLNASPTTLRKDSCGG